MMPLADETFDPRPQVDICLYLKKFSSSWCSQSGYTKALLKKKKVMKNSIKINSEKLVV